MFAAMTKRQAGADVSAHRQALAEAIPAQAAANAALERIEAALEASKRARWAAQSALKAATTASTMARQADAEALTVAALAGLPLDAVPRTEATTLAAKKAAEAALELADAERLAMDAALTVAQQRLSPPAWHIEAALEGILAPCVEPLAARINALIDEALKLGDGMFAVQRHVRGDVRGDVERAMAVVTVLRRGSPTPPDWIDPWAAAVARLKTDANTPLPPLG